MIKLSKKVLCCLLVFILSFGLLVVHGENTAETKAEGISETMMVSEEIQEIMSVLRLFEIIPEYYDYNVPVGAEVTRADFVAAVARLIGKDVYGGSNVYFYDVPKTHWAYNEISNMAELGFVNGAGNKMFKPDTSITKGEAYKILLSVMGYGVYAEYNGGFPLGYIELANKIELTKGVSNSEKLIMSDMFYLIYNAMKTDVLEPSVSGGNMTYETKEGESVLSLYRDVYYAEGVVYGAKSVTIDNETLNDGDVLIDDEVYKSGNVAMFEFMGQEVEVFYHEDQLEEKTILWASATDKNDTLTIDVENSATFDEKTFKYSYYDENGKEKTINLDRGMTLIYNGGIVESGYDEILNGERYSVKFVKNNNKYTVAVVKAYENFIAGSVSVSEFKIYDMLKPQKNITLDEDEYDTFDITLSGLGAIKFEDITSGMVLSIFESKDKKHIEVIASNNIALGTIKEISEDSEYYNVLINETEYCMEKDAYDGSISVGDDVRAHLDFNGNIAYLETADSQFKGAFLIALYKNADTDDELSIKHLAESGKVILSKCAQRVVLDGRMYKGAEEIEKALVAGEREFISQFALVMMNSNGEITEIDTVNYNPKYETEASLSVDVPFINEGETEMKKRQVRTTASAAKIGEKIIFDTDTIIFSIPSADNYKEVEEENFAVLPASGMINDTGAYAQSYKMAEEGGVSKYLLVKDYDSKSATFEFPVLVDSIGKGVDSDGNVVEVLKGYQSNAPVSINASSNTNDLFSKSGAKPGTLVKLGRNNKGDVDKCSVVYDYRDGAENINSLLNDTFGVFGGYAHSVVGDVLKIGYKSGEDFDFAIRANSLPVMIYDTKAERNQIYAGSLGDAVTYKNDPAGCSKTVIITTRMQGRMIVLYK